MHRKRALRIASVALALAALAAFPAAASAVTYSGTWSLSNVSAVSGSRLTTTKSLGRGGRVSLIKTVAVARAGKTYRPATLMVVSPYTEGGAFGSGGFVHSAVSNAAVYHDGKLVGNVHALYGSTTLASLNAKLAASDHKATVVSTKYRARIRFRTYGGTTYYSDYSTNRIINSVSFR